MPRKPHGVTKGHYGSQPYDAGPMMPSASENRAMTGSSGVTTKKLTMGADTGMETSGGDAKVSTGMTGHQGRMSHAVTKGRA